MADAAGRRATALVRPLLAALALTLAACGGGERASPDEPAQPSAPAAQVDRHVDVPPQPSEVLEHATVGAAAEQGGRLPPASTASAPSPSPGRTDQTARAGSASPPDQAAQPGRTVRPTTLKDTPALDAPDVGTLPQGAHVSVVDVRGGWYRVRSPTLEGWVRMLAVRLDAEDAATTSVPLETGRSGQGNVAATTGVRGLTSQPDPAPRSSTKGTPGSLAGRWRLNAAMPGGAQQPLLTITATDGTFEGSLTTVLGSTATAPVVGDGSAFSFPVTVRTLAGTAKLVYSGRVDGDTMSGEVQTPIVRVPFTGRREP